MKKWSLLALAALASTTLAVSPAVARDRHHSGYNRGHGGVSINIGGYGRGFRDVYRDRGYGGYYDRGYAYYNDREYYNDRSYRRDRRHHRREYRRHH